MDACGWNGGTHQDRIRRSLNRMQELISRLTSSCYALWKGSLESPTSSTSQKSVCVSRPVVPAPFLSFCSCCEPSFSEKSCPFRPRFRPAASRFQPPVSAKGVDSPNFPSLRAAKSGRRDLKIKKRGFSMRGNRRWPCSGGTPCTLLSRFSSRFFALWIFALSRGNFERRKGERKRKRGEFCGNSIDRRSLSRREENRLDEFLWKFGIEEEEGSWILTILWKLIEEERRDRKRFWRENERRILKLDDLVKIWWWRSEKRILNIDNSVKICSIEKNFEEKKELWILTILWYICWFEKVLRKEENFEFWISTNWEKSGRIFKYRYWTLMKRRENFIDQRKFKKKKII